jgi:hypothetical protein
MYLICNNRSKRKRGKKLSQQPSRLTCQKKNSVLFLLVNRDSNATNNSKSNLTDTLLNP